MVANLRSDDYYQILGCPKSASDADLKKAYRKLAVKWHPDKNPDNEVATQNFQKISEAYATLSDPKKRKLYDQYGKQGADAADQMGEGQGGMPAGFGGFGSGGTTHHMSAEEAQQMFGQFFGGSDPFAGMGGMGGGPGSSFSFSTSTSGPGGASSFQSFGPGFGGGAGGMDPISMMMGGMGGPMGPMAGMMNGMNGNTAQQQFASSSSSSVPQQTQQQYDAIPPNTPVSLRNLRSAPERNGDRGVVQRYIPSTGRYVVRLEDDEDENNTTNNTMSVKASNLVQHVGMRIHGIESQTDLNGKSGTILAWSDANQRYNVYIRSTNKVISLRPGNIVLDVGTVAQIVGTSRDELNGKWGTIKEWIRESNKYDVQLSEKQIIRVKIEVMRV